MCRAGFAGTRWGVEQLHRSLPPTEAAPARARQLVAEFLTAAGRPELSDDARLVASELAGNAARHGGPPLSLHLRLAGASLRIAVRDAQPALLPMPADPADDDISGRGLHLVAGLAASWGWEREPDSKLVWALLSTAP